MNRLNFNLAGDSAYQSAPGRQRMTSGSRFDHLLSLAESKKNRLDKFEAEAT
jgi:hypothetical protein